MLNKFIVFEGPDGAGKTTQINMLERALLDRGQTVQRVRHPGSSVVGNAVRGFLVDQKQDVSEIAKGLLMIAAIYETYRELVVPALKRGDWVLSDRWFDTTIAFQGAGSSERKVLFHSMINEIMNIDFNQDNSLNKEEFTSSLYTLYFLNVPPQEAKNRLLTRSGERNHLDEDPDEIQQVRYDGYERQAASELPYGHIFSERRPITINAHQPENDVFQEVLKALNIT